MKRNNDLKFCVYKHTIKENGKCYIGITSQPPTYRWGSDGRKYKNCPFFFKAIKKYGWDNINHEVLYENLTKEEAENIEVELIAKFKSNQDRFGYNILAGGKLGTVGVSVKEETRIKISNAAKLQKHLPMPQTTKNGIEAARWKTKKKIVQLDENMKLVKAWEGGIDIERSGIALSTNVIRACKGKVKFVSGFRWAYYEEYIKCIT